MHHNVHTCYGKKIDPNTKPEDDGLVLGLELADRFALLRRAVQELLEFWVKFLEALVLLSIGEVHLSVCSRGDNVEFGVEDIDALSAAEHRPWETLACVCE